MDDVDAVQAQIARNMFESGDWVTARLDGVPYLEKSPLVYWEMAAGYRVFGVHDWAARLPLALAVVLLCFTTYRFGRWAFGEEAGTYAGLALASCAGLFLFTRILIPDATLTLTIALAIWSVLRLLEPEEARPGVWAVVLGASIGAGLLLKGLIAAVFPVGAALAYLAVSGQLLQWQTWRRLRLPTAITVAMLIAAPWHVLATLRNPPYFVFNLHSGPGEYHGFFWFYFFNEHLLRFLNLRYPRDYNTVPRVWFWLLNLVWLFPWSVFLTGAAKLSYRPETRAGRVRLMCLCWIGFVMTFFTFSTTQEYYSMPIYPALALLIGSSLADGGAAKWAVRVLVGVSSVLVLAMGIVIALVWHLPANGEISQALTQNTELYTLSMGHMADLTLGAFAYLRFPLGVAMSAFAAMAVGLTFARSRREIALAAALSMVIFLQAARLALVKFDPYLGSYPLATALQKSPEGELIEADAYYAFSSVFFYTNRTALLWNGRMNNLEYGSFAPGAPKVFIGNDDFVKHWNSTKRHYLLAYGSDLEVLKSLSSGQVYIVAENAGNFLLTNQPLLSGVRDTRH
jgi:4-amino-4-deoxy-L-arabinose transferase-like glycosyltransferase